VLLYRIGIAVSAFILAVFAPYVIVTLRSGAISNVFASAAMALLYVSIGTSVFKIHLYVGTLHRFLKKLYLMALICLIALTLVGGGSPAGAIFSQPLYGLLLLPLSGCLGFITAKEAFCFRLGEGYLLAVVMPMHILAASLGVISPRGAAAALGMIAALLIFFTVRKTSMPLHYDIGDKSAYQP
jgi:uncharacterized integral membrane protein